MTLGTTSASTSAAPPSPPTALQAPGRNLRGACLPCKGGGGFAAPETDGAHLAGAGGREECRGCPVGKNNISI